MNLRIFKDMHYPLLFTFAQIFVYIKMCKYALEKTLSVSSNRKVTLVSASLHGCKKYIHLQIRSLNVVIMMT
jgi:hypothetical protein